MKIITEIAEASASDNTSWRCDSCGETVPGNFSSCWKCRSSNKALQTEKE